MQGTQLEDGHDDFVTLNEKALLQQCYTNKPYNMQHSIRKSEAVSIWTGVNAANSLDVDSFPDVQQKLCLWGFGSNM